MKQNMKAFIKYLIVAVCSAIVTFLTSSCTAGLVIGKNQRQQQENNISTRADSSHFVPTIIRKTKCYRFTKRNVPKRKTKRLRYRCPPEPYSNSVRTDFFSYSNAIILENQQINTSI